MSQTNDGSVTKPLEAIREYVTSAPGLELTTGDEGYIRIFQRADGRAIRFAQDAVEEVLSRQDGEGKGFLQVNFVNGKKILITERLIGFKPVDTAGLDLKKLPKVVTTPDLVSVLEAIEDNIAGTGRQDEVDVLKRVFASVLQGAEAVGFELGPERSWLNLIANVRRKPSA